ncbi:hypothetical protein FSOLCH5_001091 [Fusarium solani]|jgi:hypothetical protein
MCALHPSSLATLAAIPGPFVPGDSPSSMPCLVTGVPQARSCAFNRTCSWLAASLESSDRFDVMDRSKFLSTLSPHDFGRFGHQLTAFLGGERPDEKGVALCSFARVE